MRIRSALVVLCAVCLFALLTAPLVAKDDTPPGAPLYKLKKVGYSGFKGNIYARAWAAIDNNNSVVFAGDHIEGLNGDQDYLRSFALNRNGIPGKTNTVLDLGTGYAMQAAAFWFDETPPAAGHGLLIVAIMPEGAYNTCWIATALFDSTGARISEIQVIHEFIAPGEAYISGSWLGARRYGEFVGIAANVNHSLNTQPFYGDVSTQAAFMEVTPLGDLVSPAKVVKLPKGGEWQHLRVYAPAWNGVSWMVPAVVTILKSDTYQGRGYTEEVGYQLAMIGATPSGPKRAIKTRFRRIATDNTKIHWPTYVSPVFLPSDGAAAPAVGKSMNLVYVKAVPASGGINAADYTCYVQGINGKARRDGKSVEVDMAPWKRQYEGVQGISNEDTDCYFSNAYDAGDGKVFLTFARTATFYHSATQTSVSEMELDFCKLDPSDGSVDVLAQTSRKGYAIRSPAALRYFGGLLCSLVFCFGDDDHNFEQCFYFSTLKAK